MLVSAEDWIITGVNGEKYPCKPDIFAKTYEPVGEQPASDEPVIEKLEFPDAQGGMSLRARSPAFAAFAEECVKLFKAGGGVNYVEWGVQAADPAFGMFTVVIQRKAGETPAEQAARYRKALEEIALGRGPFSVDKMEHANNTIEAMKAAAKEALAVASGDRP